MTFKKYENQFTQGNTILVSKQNERDAAITATFCYYAEDSRKPFICYTRLNTEEITYSSWEFAWKCPEFTAYTETQEFMLYTALFHKDTREKIIVVGFFDGHHTLAVRHQPNNKVTPLALSHAFTNFTLEDKTPFGQEMEKGQQLYDEQPLLTSAPAPAGFREMLEGNWERE